MSKERWITLENGTHVLIKPGQTVKDAIGQLEDQSGAFDIEELRNQPSGQFSSIIPGKNEPAKIPFNYFGGKSKNSGGSLEIPPAPKEAFGFDRDRLFTKDHMQHQKQMGFKDSKEYNAAAISFWNNDQGKLYYSKRRGNFVKIANDGITVCFCGEDGIIHSFYSYPSKARTRQFMTLERLIEL